MFNDTVSDFITRIRNASLAGRETVNVRFSKTVQRMAELLKHANYLLKVEKNASELILTLNSDLPLVNIKVVSKPGLRRYRKSNQIPYPKSQIGLIIVSTPKGVMSGRQATKQKVGGEILCEVW